MRQVPKVMLVFVVAALLLPGLRVDAQSLSGKLVVPAADMTQMLTLDDGSTLVGRITEVGETDIKFQTDMGEMTILIAKIRDIKEVPISSIRAGEYWFPNPNRTRLLVGPTARTLKAGTGYFFDLWVFFPGVAYGVTDNIQIAGGASIIPGVDNQLFFFTPKVGFPVNEKLDLSFNLMIFQVTDATAGMAFGNMTYGTDDRSFTLGLGPVFGKEGIGSVPGVILGGESRLSRRFAVVGESWFFSSKSEYEDQKNDKLLLGLFGFRFLGDGLSVDLAIGYSAEWDTHEIWDYDTNEITYEEEFDDGWIPYIDFVYNF